MIGWDDVLQKTIDGEGFLKEIDTNGFWKCETSVKKYASNLYKDVSEFFNFDQIKVRAKL